MKKYRLDGETVPIGSLRTLVKNLKGFETAYMSEEDIVKILLEEGIKVTVDNFCGSVYSSLQWNRP